MDRRWAFLRTSRVRWRRLYVRLMIGGELAIGRIFAPQTCMRQVRLDPDHDAVMRIGGEAPGGGPILSVGISAMSATGSRHLGSSIGSPS